MWKMGLTRKQGDNKIQGGKESREEALMRSKLLEKIDKDRLYTPKEVAELFGVDPTTVRDWIRKGKLKGLKIGGRYKIEGEALLEFIKAE